MLLKCKLQDQQGVKLSTHLKEPVMTSDFSFSCSDGSIKILKALMKFA